jgi:hypothetical protein
MSSASWSARALALALCVVASGCPSVPIDPEPDAFRARRDASIDAVTPTSRPTALAACETNRNVFDVPPPEATFERDSWRFELLGSELRSVSGTVLSTARGLTPPVIEQGVFLGTGAFLDPGCLTEQSGTSFRWSGVACTAGPGTLFNAFLVVPEALTGFTALIASGQTVRISGYEIERYLDFSPGGGFWSDGGDNGMTGQVSLWVTDVCVE